MLNLIKKLFKGEEIPKKELSLSEIKPYFDERVKEQLAQLEHALVPLQNSIKTGIEQARQALSSLGSAQLQNDKIFPRERQLMEGNRESYVKLTEQFLQTLAEKELTIHTTETYVESFNEELQRYSQATERNYMVLQEFFAHESRDVTNALKQLKETVLGINQLLEKLHTQQLMEIQILIDKIANRLQAADEYRESIQRKQNEINSIEKQKSEFAGKLKSMEVSKEIQEFKDFEKKRQDILPKMEQMKESFYAVFSQLQHALKKYAKQSLEPGILELYEQDPVQALLNDGELKIVGILRKVKEALEKGTLDLKDTKRDKVIEALKILTKDYFENFIKKYKPLRDEKVDLDHKLRTHKHMQEYNEAKYRLEHCGEKIAGIQKEIAALKEQQAKKTAIDDIKEQLVGLFKTVFGVELVIRG